MNGADVALKAREFLSVKYRHQGRSRGGVDCIGLPACVRAELGLTTLDVTDYAPRATDEAMRDWCRLHMLEIAAPEIGCVLVMAYGTDRHMAIVADCEYGGLSIIHAFAENRRVVENRLGDDELARVIGCFRFPEVTV